VEKTCKASLFWVPYAMPDQEIPRTERMPAVSALGNSKQSRKRSSMMVRKKQ